MLSDEYNEVLFTEKLLRDIADHTIGEEGAIFRILCDADAAQALHDALYNAAHHGIRRVRAHRRREAQAVCVIVQFADGLMADIVDAVKIEAGGTVGRHSARLPVRRRRLDGLLDATGSRGRASARPRWNGR